MADLSFLQPQLDALGAYFEARAGTSEWHITHNTFHRSAEARRAVEARLGAHGVHTSYLDEIDDPERPFWLDSMERVPPDVGEISVRIARVIDALAAADGEYNSFTLIGSGGESWPP
jgi:hypothetical protein